MVRSRPNLLIVEHRRGWVMANAGVDQSNVGGTGKLLLLPQDPDASAERLRVALMQCEARAMEHRASTGVVENRKQR